MTLATTILAFLGAILLLVTVHEFGHYLVARWFGVRILRFSVGFGHALISRRFGRDQTEWVLAAIPLGGYVRMLDSREGDVPPELRHRSFDAQPVLTRMAIVFAGPLVNLVLAALIYAGLGMYGVVEWRPVIAEPPAGSQAAESGLTAGSTVLAVNGDRVSTWSEFQLKVLDQTLAKADAVTLTLRDSFGERQIRGLELNTRSHDLSDADVLTQLGLRLFRPLVPPVIGTLQPGKPAAGAGLRVGDRVQTVDGNPVEDWAELVELVRQSSGEIVTLSLLRETALLTVAIRPERLEEGGKKIARIGVGPLRSGEPDARFQIIVRHDPVSALGDGVQRTASGAWLSLRMMGKMLIGELSWRNLSGPVTIADYAGKSARVSLVAYLSFLAMISISLGVLNLLPIPLLDGGHLMYYSAELLTGSPVPEKIAELGQKAGILVLGCLMAFAFFNDLNRLFSG